MDFFSKTTCLNCNSNAMHGVVNENQVNGDLPN